MILESAVLDVKPGQTEHFELVRWRRPEDHTEGFRKPGPYQRYVAVP
jgi:hypothetical protein